MSKDISKDIMEIILTEPLMLSVMFVSFVSA